MDRFFACFDGLDDPRTGNAALHDFCEILIIAMGAVLGGGQGAVDIGLFAQSKQPFLRGFLKRENGVPSRATPELTEGQPAFSDPRSRTVPSGVSALHGGVF